MKTSKEIIAEMSANHAEIQRLEQAEKALDFPAARRARDKVQFDALVEQSAALHREIETRKILGAILYDNARRAIFAETVPAAVECLFKFSGKPYGPKTKEKIAAMCREKTGCTVYIESRYSWDELSIYPRDFGYNFPYNAFSVSFDRKEYQLMDGNKIGAPIPAEAFSISNCAAYVDDPHARAAEIIAERETLNAKFRDFEKACSAFNSLLPSGIPNKNARDFRGYWRQ